MTKKIEIKGDLNRFVQPPGFADDEGVDLAEGTLERSDPDYVLKLAILAGANVTFEDFN